nr:hypothetical protein [Tanacetum cinerariifolium]
PWGYAFELGKVVESWEKWRVMWRKAGKWSSGVKTIDNGIRLMLAPRSDRVRQLSNPVKSQGIRKRPGSPSFSGIVELELKVIHISVVCCGVSLEFAVRNRVLLWRCLKIRVLRWTVMIDSSLVGLTVLIEIIALKRILVVVWLTRLMKSRWTHLIRNILTVTQTSVTALRGAVGVMKKNFILLRDFSNWFCIYQAYLQGLQLSAEDQKSLSKKKKEEEHLRLPSHQ